MVVGTSQQLNCINSYNSFYKKLIWCCSRNHLQLRAFSYMTGLLWHQGHLQDVNVMTNPGEKDSSLKGQQRRGMGTIHSQYHPTCVLSLWISLLMSGTSSRGQAEIGKQSRRAMSWLRWQTALALHTAWRVKIAVSWNHSAILRTAGRQWVLWPLATSVKTLRLQHLTSITFTVINAKEDAVKPDLSLHSL